MADTDALRPYTRNDAPTIPGSEQRYLSEELKKVQGAIGLLISTMKKLEARMTAHGV